MVAVYCLISFVLGWYLSAWFGSRAYAKAKETTRPSDQIYYSSEENATPFEDNEQIIDEFTLIDDKCLEKPLTADRRNGKDNSSWSFDHVVVELEQEHCPLDADAQTLRYFIDNFRDESQLLCQRVEALKSALSMKPELLSEEMIAEIYHLLVAADESKYPDQVIYLLWLLQPYLTAEQLPGIATFLRATNADIREQVLKLIAALDSDKHYHKHFEDILRNDPQSEIRALAFELLEQHYGGIQEQAA